ncbi:hypothetical protein [Streptomyces sp. NPDC048623]|uniref:hypothetical protein n=1 Tax=Streptomyces sp. NPDC048623 TaxID=3155761 RepID=UPI0034407023
MTGIGAGGGLFALLWGTWTAGVGLVVARDVHEEANRLGWKSPGDSFLRGAALMCTNLGCAVLALGAIEAWSGGLAGGLPQVPAAYLLPMVLAEAFGLWALWRPTGPLRRGRGRHRQVVDAVLTAAFKGFAVGLALGQGALMVVSWLLGGAAGLALFLRRPDEKQATP